MVLDGDDFGSLQALRPFSNFEFDFLAFVECLESVDLDFGEMDKEILAIFPLNETKALLITKPFYGTFCQPSYLPSSIAQAVAIVTAFFRSLDVARMLSS